MRKMKRARRWTGVLLAGFIGAGACFSGAVVTGTLQQIEAEASEKLEMKEGEEKEILVPFYGSSYSLSPGSSSLMFISSDENVASAHFSGISMSNMGNNVKGVIQAKQAGQATIYAYDQENVMIVAQYDINVSENLAESIELYKGESREFEFSYYTDGFSYSIDPYYSTTILKVSTSKSQIFDSIIAKTTLDIQFNEIGEYDIEFFDVNRKPVKKIKVIAKKRPEVSNIELDENLLVLEKDKTVKLTSTVTPDAAEDKTVTWSSSNTNVATVDSSGNVKGISQGKAKITAKTVNGKTATCDVRVLFSDVTNPKDWYYTPVYWAADNGITTGAGGKFAPTGYSTREQTVTFIWRMWGSPEPKNLNSKFSDVQNKKSYSYKAIMWANENGVVTGSKGKFALGVPCTREQIVTILWRLAGKPEPKTKTSPFKDVQNPKSYSYKAILWASENGITTGANGKFAPANKCLRREMVTFLYRYNKLYNII